ncbi:MAG TPA: ubiquinol-cytochrome c reductase iron-sulfur subunit [Acidobacteriota bacterium]|nr:ubiquinol-cytochrome c reductase iron-sulfur subunit [Acidobacteriota bacterium]HNB72908.1 ubiquinol-cytochrome c reductase iron-sulfur subunit [Acidobacteriota bacterium]HNC44372.1 ubiquinol-cytochrome c reductase iron-sulfur subunit [Acidobacteriota bacterium]
MTQSDAPHDVDGSRRTFLGLAIALIGAGVAGVMGVTIYGYAVAQALKTSASGKEGNWIDVGPLNDFKDGIPTQKSITVVTREGWVNSQTEEAIWVIKQGDTFTVVTATCPHLGCKVQWQDEGQSPKFFCPCHASSFEKSGKLIQGASARGLDTLNWRKSPDGRLLQVDFKRFKALIAEKVELV